MSGWLEHQPRSGREGVVSAQQKWLSAKRTVTGHPGSVRQPWHPHAKADKLIAGRENGQVGCGELRRRMTRKTA